jgi:predicted GNAT family N-acyltransferase
LELVMEGLSYKLGESRSELSGALAVRRRVFVEEQGIAEALVFDGNDGGALYAVVKNGTEVIGTARVRFLSSRRAKLERMAVLDGWRRMGIGSRVTSFVVEELKKRGVEQVVLQAQCAVVPFYKSCGFDEIGLPFGEAGVEHIEMRRQV